MIDVRNGGQREPVAAALGVQAAASLDVAVNELRVLAPRAEDSTRIDRAETLGPLWGGCSHRFRP